MKQLNLNYQIKLKLNDYGKQIYRNQYKQEFANQPEVARYCDIVEPTVDDEGYTSMQLWFFMRVFGSHCLCGKEPFCEENSIFIDDWNLKEV